ncbi:tetratricopeptide repeat protein [Algivirga pacifica]|uniref:Tetratricopeptide repeat-containing protein n=1 Tax=Algivirga pacifica TaxID=1162670 RepID=A0ABP9D423_9BACT
MKRILPLALALVTSLFISLQAQAQVQELIDRSQFMVENNRYEDAIIMLNNAIKIEPNNAELSYKKASIYSSMARFPEAIQALEEATEKDPAYTEAFGLMGDLYSQSKDVAKAIESYDKAFKASKEIEFQYHYKLKIIDQLESYGMIRDLKKHVEDAKKIIGDTFELSYYAAMYYNEVGDHEKALELSEKIVQDIQPVTGTEMYYEQYCIALINLREFETVRKLQDELPGNITFHLQDFTDTYYLSLANAYTSIMDYDESIKALEIAIGLNPLNDEAAQLHKKLVSMKDKESDKVIDAYIKTLASEKNIADKSKKLLSIAQLLFEAGDFSGTVEYINQYQELSLRNARDINVVFMRASAEMQANENGLAIEQVSKIVRNPQFSSKQKVTFYLLLGVAYKKAGDYDAAEQALKNAYAGAYKNVVKHEFKAIRKLRGAQPQ